MILESSSWYLELLRDRREESESVYLGFVNLRGHRGNGTNIGTWTCASHRLVENLTATNVNLVYRIISPQQRPSQ